MIGTRFFTLDGMIRRSFCGYITSLSNLRFSLLQIIGEKSDPFSNSYKNAGFAPGEIFSILPLLIVEEARAFRFPNFAETSFFNGNPLVGNFLGDFAVRNGVERPC